MQSTSLRNDVSFGRSGMVGCGEGVVYLTSPGHPTDIGLQLGKDAILVAGRCTD